MMTQCWIYKIEQERIHPAMMKLTHLVMMESTSLTMTENLAWGYKVQTLKQNIGETPGGMFFPNNIPILYAFWRSGIFIRPGNKDVSHTSLTTTTKTKVWRIRCHHFSVCMMQDHQLLSRLNKTLSMYLPWLSQATSRLIFPRRNWNGSNSDMTRPSISLATETSYNQSRKGIGLLWRFTVVEQHSIKPWLVDYTTTTQNIFHFKKEMFVLPEMT